MRDGEPGADLAREPAASRPSMLPGTRRSGLLPLMGRRTTSGCHGASAAASPSCSRVSPLWYSVSPSHANDEPQTPAAPSSSHSIVVVRRRHGGDRCAAERDGLPCVDRNDPSRRVQRAVRRRSGRFARATSSCACAVGVEQRTQRVRIEMIRMRVAARDETDAASTRRIDHAFRHADVRLVGALVLARQGIRQIRIEEQTDGRPHCSRNPLCPSHQSRERRATPPRRCRRAAPRLSERAPASDSSSPARAVPV